MAVYLPNLCPMTKTCIQDGCHILKWDPAGNIHCVSKKKTLNQFSLSKAFFFFFLFFFVPMSFWSVSVIFRVSDVIFPFEFLLFYWRFSFFFPSLWLYKSKIFKIGCQTKLVLVKVPQLWCMALIKSSWAIKVPMSLWVWVTRHPFYLLI